MCVCARARAQTRKTIIINSTLPLHKLSLRGYQRDSLCRAYIKETRKNAQGRNHTVGYWSLSTGTIRVARHTKVTNPIQPSLYICEVVLKPQARILTQRKLPPPQPVSYTHLDVYKRQHTDTFVRVLNLRHSSHNHLKWAYTSKV